MNPVTAYELPTFFHQASESGNLSFPLTLGASYASVPSLQGHYDALAAVTTNGTYSTLRTFAYDNKIRCLLVCNVASAIYLDPCVHGIVGLQVLQYTSHPLCKGYLVYI